ncbi:MAG TPA: Fic family protein [Kiritimatiellia bacterium]|nr:Fic family protein [Kiritimatiellia bacterium]
MVLAFGNSSRCYTQAVKSIITARVREREYNKVRREDFENGFAARLVQTPQGYWAYVPPPLEPEIQFDRPLVRLLSDADRALSELAGIARTLPNPHLLIAPFVRREAVLSSRIEGTQASYSDLLFFEAANLREKDVPDVREVANYVKALEYGLKRVETLPLSLRLIREIHAQLLDGVRGDHLTPGEFRRTQNWIGPAGCTLQDATYVPPPVTQMHECLSTLEKYFHSPSELPPLVRLALVHYQFESIHPFLDGNGRIGRLLITLLLCKERLLPQPLLYLSEFFERKRDEYYRLLLAVSQRGAWHDWISYFLRAVASQSRDAIRRSDQLLALRQAYREKLQEARASALLLQIVDDLFLYPAITNPGTSKRLGITPRAAQLNIDKLVTVGILTEATGQRRNRVYVAAEIVHVLERVEQLAGSGSAAEQAHADG